LKVDHDKSSVVSDLPSLHGFKNPDCSLHSLHNKSRNARAQVFDILNDPYLNKGVASERLSCCSDYSFGNSRQDTKKIFQIATEPFRILDTPGMADNYYSHLLAWSRTNVLAICLAETVYLFNYETSEFDELYQAEEGESMASLAFSADGDSLAIGNSEGLVTLWDLEMSQPVRTINNHSARVACLDWHQQGLLSGSKDSQVLLNDSRSRRFDVRSFLHHTQEIVGLKWDHCGNRFASGGNDNQALVWSLTSSDNKPTMQIKHKAAVRAVGWSHKIPGLLATGGGYSDATIRTFDTNRNIMVDERETDGQVCSLLFSRLTNDLISSHGLPSNDLSVWRTNGLKRVVQLMGHDVRPIHICLSPDATMLVSASPDETLRFWRLYDTEMPSKRPIHLPTSLNYGSQKSERNTSVNNDGLEMDRESNDNEGFWDPPEQDFDERSDLDFPMCGPESSD
jgi:WD40 repeat protein